MALLQSNLEVWNKMCLEATEKHLRLETEVNQQTQHLTKRRNIWERVLNVY